MKRRLQNRNPSHYQLWISENLVRNCLFFLNPSLYILILTHWKKSFMKTLWKKVKLHKMSNFTLFHKVFYAICILKSFKSHISVVICSFFEFGTVSKWCIGEWVKWNTLNDPRLFNPFPHNDTFWRLWKTSLLKTLWEKEKLLVTSNFSFSHSVFYRFG